MTDLAAEVLRLKVTKVLELPIDDKHRRQEPAVVAGIAMRNR